MKRALAVALALAVLGAVVTLSSPDCVDGFRIEYVALRDLITDAADHERQCDLLAEAIIDLDAASAELALTASALRRRLRAEVVEGQAGGLGCELSYAGSTATETAAVLRVLALMSAVSISQEARALRARAASFINAELAERVEHRIRMESRRTGAHDGEIASADLIIEQLNEKLAEAMHDPPEMACVEHAVRSHVLSDDERRALAARCRTARPVSIASWPAPSPDCRR